MFLSTYCKFKGQTFLVNLLEPFFQQIMELPYAVEVDPNRCSENIEQNVQTLTNLTKQFLSELYKNASSFPSYVNLFKKKTVQIIS
jgi:hypothetical protein